MEIYIKDEKKIYNSILEFFEMSNEDSEEKIQKYLPKNMIKSQNEESSEEMKQLLLMIKNISDHHHRNEYFLKRINQILQYYKDQIKQTLSNIEIYNIFKNNKILLLFLLKNGIITISEMIYNDLNTETDSNGNRYCHFFYPEIEKFKGSSKMKNIKNENISINTTIFEDFEEKRQEGENDSFICSLIRNDSVEEFIAYINRNNISLESEITPSIFETNSFLMNQKNTNLIEYSAFFGSIQIFQYLLMNNVELTPSLWLYSIHSKNPEIIHILESYKISPPQFNNINNGDNSYLKCFIESIKCHHNDLAKYFEDNFMIKHETESKLIKEVILSNCLKYHNYSYFQVDTICENGFLDLCLYNYNKLIELLLKGKEIEKKAILKKLFFYEEMIL